MIKAEFNDLGPRNGMAEPDQTGSYRAFMVIEKGDAGDEPQRLTFIVPAHQLPTDLALVAEAYEDAATGADLWLVDTTLDGTIGGAIRARVPADAQAARDARDADQWNDALSAAIKATSHLQISDEVTQAIEALRKDKTNE